MEANSLRERLAALAPPQLTVFGLGCVTHAMELLSRSDEQDASAATYAVADLLDKFWSNYPASLAKEVAQPLSVAAGDLAPDQHDASLGPGEEYLIWASAYGFTVAVRTVVDQAALGEAVGAAENAYLSVFAATHERDQVYSTDEQILDVETSSDISIAEIEFQLAYLAAIEAIDGEPPRYGTILEQMSDK